MALLLKLLLQLSFSHLGGVRSLKVPDALLQLHGCLFLLTHRLYLLLHFSRCRLLLGLRMFGGSCLLLGLRLAYIDLVSGLSQELLYGHLYLLPVGLEFVKQLVLVTVDLKLLVAKLVVFDHRVQLLLHVLQSIVLCLQVLSDLFGLLLDRVLSLFS